MSYRGVQCTLVSRNRCIHECHPTGKESRSLGSGNHVPHSPLASHYSLCLHKGSHSGSVGGSGKCSLHHGSHTCPHSGRDWGHTGLSPPGRGSLLAEEHNEVTLLSLKHAHRSKLHRESVNYRHYFMFSGLVSNRNPCCPSCTQTSCPFT